MALTLDGLEKWYVNTYKMRCAFAGETPVEPTPLPDVTNIDGLLEGIVAESEDAFVALADDKGIHYTYGEAYTINLPSKLYRWNGVKKVGGRSFVNNQMLENGDFALGTETWGRNVTAATTLSSSDGELIITIASLNTGTAYGFRKATGYDLSFVLDHVYYVKADIYAPYTDDYCYGNSTIMGSGVKVTFAPKPQAGEWTTCSGMFTSIATATARPTFYPLDYSLFSVDDAYKVRNFIQIDLTVMFGAGNEPTLEECDAMFSGYIEYDTGTLMSAGVTDIVSKDSTDAVIDTLTIPAEVQALTGYGDSCPDHVNYIDFEEKKYFQYVGSRAYEAGDESDTDVITDGTTTYYALDTPVETDISAYLTDTDIDAEAGGSVTFVNQLGDGYKIPVPIEVDYIGK